MKILIPFVALAAMLPLVPAQADPGTRTQVVAFRDLDLTSAKGKARLDRRIQRASGEVCGAPSDFDLAGQNDMKECRAQTAAAALARVDAQLAAANRTVRVAAVTD